MVASDQGFRKIGINKTIKKQDLVKKEPQLSAFTDKLTKDQEFMVASLKCRQKHE